METQKTVTIKKVFKKAQEIREALREAGFPVALLDNEKEFELMVLESCNMVKELGVEVLYD